MVPVQPPELVSVCLSLTQDIVYLVAQLSLGLSLAIDYNRLASIADLESLAICTSSNEVEIEYTSHLPLASSRVFDL